MPRLCFTSGNFDRFNQKDKDLLHQCNKSSYPDGEVYILVFDDYSIFDDEKVFPIHSLDKRIENLKLFIDNPKNIIPILKDDVEDAFINIVNKAQIKGLKPFYIVYDDNKQFKGREVLKNLGVPIKFIKHDK